MFAAFGSPSRIAVPLLVAVLLPLGTLRAQAPAADGAQGTLRWSPHQIGRAHV